MAVHLCRCWLSGKVSLCMTIDANLRRELGLQERDVIGFRVVTVQGKKLMVGEKIPLNKIALLANMPVDVLPHDR